MARIICKKSIRRETKTPQFTRGEVLTCLKSLGYDLKPSDLILSKVKWGLNPVKA